MHVGLSHLVRERFEPDMFGREQVETPFEFLNNCPREALLSLNFEILALDLSLYLGSCPPISAWQPVGKNIWEEPGRVEMELHYSPLIGYVRFNDNRLFARDVRMQIW